MFVKNYYFLFVLAVVYCTLLIKTYFGGEVNIFKEVIAIKNFYKARLSFASI